MLSRTAEYAVRAVVWLASHPEPRHLGVRQIAEGTTVPSSYLSKVLQALSRAGLVSSKRGVDGGHRLTRAPSEITLLEVVNAVDPIQRTRGCPLGLKSHQGRLCGMHSRLDEAARLVEQALEQSTIAEVLDTPERPQPMVESPSFLPNAGLSSPLLTDPPIAGSKSRPELLRKSMTTNHPLPQNAAPTGSSPTFTEKTLPPACQQEHALAPGRWGVLHLEEGEACFIDLETSEESLLRAPARVTIRPGRRHKLRIEGAAMRCRIDFFQEESQD